MFSGILGVFRCFEVFFGVFRSLGLGSLEFRVGV